MAAKSSFRSVHGARQGAGRVEHPYGVAKRREMARTGDAAGGGLEAGDAAEMRGHADGAAAIAADAAGRAERGDGRRFAAAGAARRALRVPGVVGTSGDVVVRLVAAEKLGGVGLAQHDSAFGLKPRHHGGVARGAVALAQTAAAEGGVARHVETVLNGDGNAVQHAEGLAVGDLGFGLPRGRQGFLRKYRREGVDTRGLLRNLIEVRREEVHGGNPALTHHAGHEAKRGAIRHPTNSLARPLRLGPHGNVTSSYCREGHLPPQAGSGGIT